MKVAYSNEAFELWYLLHFMYLDTGVDRKQYMKKLDKEFKKAFKIPKYAKNTANIYELLKDKQSTAIKNAKTLTAKYGTLSNPENCKPITTVHLLVEELLNESLEKRWK